MPASLKFPARWTTTCAALLAGLLAAGGALGAADTGAIASQLPDMGSPENALLSKTDEYQIGLMAIRQLRGQELILEDPELTDYIQHLAHTGLEN